MRWVCGGTHPSVRRQIHVAVLLNLNIRFKTCTLCSGSAFGWRCDGVTRSLFLVEKMRIWARESPQ